MKLNPETNIGHLKLELYTMGMQIDKSCDVENDGRSILRTRGGLGSGLEVILPGNYYVNVPVVEHFAVKSPYTLKKIKGEYELHKSGKQITRVRLPQRPKFYDRLTTSGKKMSRIGVMQGTYLAIYASSVCQFWEMKPSKNCRFCSIGLNLGKNEDITKSVADVLEVVEAAREEEGITFVHFNSGFNYENEFEDIIPYLEAVKKETGLLVGIQIPPLRDLSKYEQLKKLGADHISICLEFFNSEEFTRYCPGKSEFLGQETFLNAIEHAAKVFGKGKVAGEIIVGLEPIADTLAAIEAFAKLGAVSTICVFRPCVGTNLENVDSPKAEEIAPAFAKMYEECVKHNIPIDIAPKVKVSLVVLPYEGKFFVEPNLRNRLFGIEMSIIKTLFYAFFYTKIFMKRLHIYMELARPDTLAAPFVGMLSGALIAIFVGKVGLNLGLIASILLAAFSASLLNGASNSINQYYDIEIDKINKPSRPLASGRISKRETMTFTIAVYFISLLLATAASRNPLQTFVVFLIALVLTVIYSMPPFRTKRLTWGSNLTIALARGLLLTVAGWSVVSSVAARDPWTLGVIFGIFIFFAASTKDLHDVVGDRAYGIKTLPVVYGEKNASRIISVGFLLPFIALFVVAGLGLLSASSLYLEILSLALLTWGIFIVYSINHGVSDFQKIWKQMYLIMMGLQLGLIAVYFLTT